MLISKLGLVFRMTQTPVRNDSDSRVNPRSISCINFVVVLCSVSDGPGLSREGGRPWASGLACSSCKLLLTAPWVISGAPRFLCSLCPLDSSVNFAKLGGGAHVTVRPMKFLGSSSGAEADAL